MRACALGSAGTSTGLAVHDALTTAARGTPVVVEGLLRETGFLDQVTDRYLAVAAELVGADAARRLRRDGLEHLHEVCAPDQVVALLGELDGRLRPMTMPMAQALVAATGPSLGRRYFVATRISARAMVPLAVLEPHAELRAVAHLRGHLTPVDAHRDPDLTHPRGVVVCWGAIGPIRAGNTIALHPDPAAPPINPVLEPGDLLLFNADGLHGTVPNRTDETRVGIGLRVVPGTRIRFGSGHHWRPYFDARLYDTRLAALATWQSRCTTAAFRRWRWRRAWEREQLRTRGVVPTLTRR